MPKWSEAFDGSPEIPRETTQLNDNYTQPNKIPMQNKIHLTTNSCLSHKDPSPKPHMYQRVRSAQVRVYR
jgi:hypothetical protein